MSALEDQFVAEARELIRQATDNLIALERDGMSPERIDNVFRAFHTLKGSAGVVELPAMSVVLHAAEDLLDSVRHGSLGAGAEVVDAALACLDQVSRWVDNFEAAGGYDRFCRVEVGSSRRPPYQIFRRKVVRGHCPNGSHS